MYRRDEEVLRARNHCHSNVTNPPAHGPEHENLKVSILHVLFCFVFHKTPDVIP